MSVREPEPAGLISVSGERDMLVQALAYAACGWPVFPCKPGFKVPAIPAAHPRGSTCTRECGRDGHGFYDATTDPVRIREWWHRYPGANVAIRTGSPGPDVLDVDTGPAGSGWAAFGALKRAGLLDGASALIRTRSGGLHVYFAGTSQPSGRMPRPHFLDFKAAGGYVLAPPSFVRADDKPAGSYELIDHRSGTGRLDWQAARRLIDPQRNHEPRNCARRGHVSHLAEWVAAQPEGNRNAGLYWAARRVDPDNHDAAEQLVAAAVEAGLTEFAARRTVASAARRSLW
jgi:Bifunctional DNA primase/polymerase, N-terminal